MHWADSCSNWWGETFKVDYFLLDPSCVDLFIHFLSLNIYFFLCLRVIFREPPNEVEMACGTLLPSISTFTTDLTDRSRPIGSAYPVSSLWSLLTAAVGIKESVRRRGGGGHGVVYLEGVCFQVKLPVLLLQSELDTRRCCWGVHQFTQPSRSSGILHWSEQNADTKSD